MIPLDLEGSTILADASETSADWPPLVLRGSAARPPRICRSSSEDPPFLPTPLEASHVATILW